MHSKIEQNIQSSQIPLTLDMQASPTHYQFPTPQRYICYNH